MSRTSLDPTLVQAYRRTRYSAGLDGEAIVLRVDVPSPVMAAAIAAAGGPGAAFITAVACTRTNNLVRLARHVFALKPRTLKGSVTTYPLAASDLPAAAHGLP